VVALGWLSLAAGFGQFSAVASLGDVARSFGHFTHGTTLAEQAGLSGTTLGVGLAVLRLASLGGLPLAGLADQFGRRRLLISGSAAGLALTVLAAASPGYWWFVALFALGRPLLSSAAALAQVSAAEQTSSVDRAKAVALVTAGYGIGSGLTAVVHGVFGHTIGFRGVFALALVPTLALPVVARRVVESDRFAAATPAGHGVPVLGPVGAAFRRRLAVVCLLAFALSVVTGPATSFYFLYLQNVRGVSGAVTAAVVTAAGLAGFVGLLTGRLLADRLGRRLTAAVAMAALCGFGVLTYSGSDTAAGLGYVLGILAGSVFAPAAGAFVNELFPTSVRASVAGWQVAAGVLGAVVGLVAFGAIADVGNRFAVAAAVTFLPVVAATGLVWLLPETRGREPEELWPAG
jgi:putative MFS transporter